MLAVSYPLCHEYIRLTQAIGVWYDPDNDKATFLVELEGMPAQVSDVGNMRPDIWVQIDPAECRHIGLIIAAQHHRQATALPHLYFEIGNQGAPEPTPLS